MSASKTYNADVIAEECPRCGVVGRRCRGSVSSGSFTAAHLPRINAAGYDWDKVNKQLVKREANNDVGVGNGSVSRISAQELTR